MLCSKAGQEVKKGDLLARIENEDIEKNYRILKETEEIAKGQFERANSLLKSGVSSKNTVEEKYSLLLETQRKLSDAKISLEELKIYAPFDGIVGIFKLREGSQLNTGDAIVSVYDPKSVLVEFDLPLSAAKEVNDGGSIIIDNQEYRLTHIQKMLDEETHMCPAYAEIRCSGCIIGTAIEVTVVIREITNAVVIPFEAVFLKETKPYVYIAEEGKALLKAVELGIRDKKRVEIKSGLNPGDKVIAFGHNRLYPGAAVKIHVEETK